MINNSFKLWFKGQELWEHIVWLWRQVNIVNEAYGDLKDMNPFLKAYNDHFCEQLGLDKDDPENDFASKAASFVSRKLSGARLEERLTDMLGELTMKLASPETVAAIKQRRFNDDGTPKDKLEGDRAIRGYVIAMIQRSFADTGRKSGSRLAQSLYGRLEKAVEEDRPFNEFGSSPESNEAAKEYFIQHFYNIKPRDYDSFLKFLNTYQHKNAAAIASGSTSLDAGAEGEAGVGASIHAPSAAPTQSYEMELKSYLQLIRQELQKMYSVASESQKAIIDLAGKILPLLLKYEGVKQGDRGDTASNQIKAELGLSNSQYYPAHALLKKVIEKISLQHPELQAGIQKAEA